VQDTLTAPEAAAAEPPLVVDLDGTLLKSDLLVEGFFALVAADPLAALSSIAALKDGRAPFKQRVAAAAAIDFPGLPWNAAFLDYLRRERGRGRRIWLASASDRRWVEAVAAHFGIFDGVFGSDGTVNLKAEAKAARLTQEFGAQGFDYAGNETADLPVWQAARRVIVVNADRRLTRDALARWPTALVIGSEGGGLRDYVRALRVHQWLKNLLLFVPAAAAHDLTVGAIFACLLGFLSFSLCASSVYLLNDLIDLGRDRAHPTKCRRPLASGAIPVLRGLALVPILLAVSLVLAAVLRPDFLLVLVAYYCLTLAYSLVLKRQMMLDVVTLACLYGIRLIAGGAAVGVDLSAWLAAFSIFLFCCLALVKRCAELAGRRGKAGAAAGRAYQAEDLPILEALAAASGFTAVLVLALYINSPDVRGLYHVHSHLWLLCVVLIYWIGRVLVLTHRGQMHDDPVVFAASDKASLATAAVGALIVLSSL
jgi:4-hydroxybenzoate polyprenyltransferase/phosphoserine phosphatase